MTMFHARYTVTVSSVSHGDLRITTGASSAIQARKQVMDFEGCPPSCITKIDRVNVLLPVRPDGYRPLAVLHMPASLSA